MRIHELQIENFKRIRAITIQVQPGVLEIRGRNGQGKTSVLDAVMAALGGKAAGPDQPVRNGSHKAAVRVNLGDYVVTRTWSAAGGSNLTVARADGKKITSPQTTLDQLFALGSFDPYAFVDATEADQAQQLQTLLRVDVSDLDAQAATVYGERAEVNAACRSSQAILSAMAPAWPDVPAEELTAADLHTLAQQARAQAMHNDRVRRDLVAVADSYARKNNEHADLLVTIQEVQKRLADLELKRDSLAKQLAALSEKHLEAAGYVDALVDPDLDDIQGKQAAVEATNRKVRHNREREAEAARLQANQDHAARLTAQLDRLKQDRLGRFTAAAYPLPGLGFDGESITFRGAPLKQASSAEQIWVGLGVCAALRPELRTVLIRDGSLLDAQSMDALRTWADATDFQVLIERVSEHGADGAVLIEDGSVQA